MTTWQWQVILALCRLVINKYNYEQIRNSQNELDFNLLVEAVKRES